MKVLILTVAYMFEPIFGFIAFLPAGLLIMTIVLAPPAILSVALSLMFGWSLENTFGGVLIFLFAIVLPGWILIDYIRDCYKRAQQELEIHEGES